MNSAALRHASNDAQLLRFLARQQRSETKSRKRISPLTSNLLDTLPKVQTSPSPFLPRKVAGTKKWRPAHIGLRTWKRLFIASNFGKDVPLPEGPKGKAEKLIAREADRLKAVGEEAELLRLAKEHWPALVLKSKTENSLASLGARNAYLQSRGPYSGRKIAQGTAAFKGHKWEQRKRDRQIELSRRAGRMQEQIVDLQRVRVSYLVAPRL